MPEILRRDYQINRAVITMLIPFISALKIVVGVDDSPSTIAKRDHNWYYDHYDYGDNDKIDEYLESQGYD